jgi:DNA mismatch repair protein MSH5
MVDKETEYADRMAEAVKQVEGTINGAVEAIAELDWYVSLVDIANDSLLALANSSRQYHLVKPIMTDRPVLEINEGRHLIQEQLVHTYVTNDTLLQGGHQQDGDSGLNSMVSNSYC